MREEASAPCVHPKKLSGYYRVHDAHVLIGCKKRDAHHRFRFPRPEVILDGRGRHGELGGPPSSALQRGGHQNQARFVCQERSNISCPKLDKNWHIQEETSGMVAVLRT